KHGGDTEQPRRNYGIGVVKKLGQDKEGYAARELHNSRWILIYGDAFKKIQCNCDSIGCPEKNVFYPWLFYD
ncbi:MAG: hypothetical protein WD491_08775, partial [Balneolales bacterium]